MKDLEEYSHQELWDLVKLNNYEAFEVIYKRFWSPMLISAYNILEEKETCKDIVQEVFTDLWLKRTTTFISSLPGYLKVSVRNQVFKHLRKGKIKKKHIDTLEKISFVNATEQMVNYNQLVEMYDGGVDKLPPRCKEVFILSRHKHLSVKEIATHLNISPKTVENQITKALKILRASLYDTMIVLFFLTFSIQ